MTKIRHIEQETQVDDFPYSHLSKMRVVSIFENERDCSKSNAANATMAMFRLVSNVCTELRLEHTRIDFGLLEFGDFLTVREFNSADVAVIDISVASLRPYLLYQIGIRQSLGHSYDLITVHCMNQHIVQDIKCVIHDSECLYYKTEIDIDGKVKISAINVLSNMKRLNRRFSCPVSPEYYSARQQLKELFQTASKTPKSKGGDEYLTKLRKWRSIPVFERSEKIWDELCQEAFSDDIIGRISEEFIVDLLITFRDDQRYDLILKVEEIFEKSKGLSCERTDDATFDKILYMFAFTRSRYGESEQRDQAIAILDELDKSSEVTGDIICLYGRIHKERYIEGQFKDDRERTLAIEYYSKSFEIQPNIYAGINIITLTLVHNHEAINEDPSIRRILLMVSSMLGQKGAINASKNYWDVASYFELCVQLRQIQKAADSALYMYLLDPPCWCLRTTTVNIKLMIRRYLRNVLTAEERENTDYRLFEFWIDFFIDAVEPETRSDISYPVIVKIISSGDPRIEDRTNDNTEHRLEHFSCLYMTIGEAEVKDDILVVFNIFVSEKLLSFCIVSI
ncbi:hypothetical protein ACOME3_004451 [Neoechinorhynchus agilis]